METSVTFPGVAAIVPAARRYVRGILADSPRVDDAELIAAELAANAIRHTPSGHAAANSPSASGASRDGRASRLPTKVQANGIRCAATPMTSAGRGLAIVAALADRLGHDLTTGGAQTVWAEITWPEHPGHS